MSKIVVPHLSCDAEGVGVVDPEHLHVTRQAEGLGQLLLLLGMQEGRVHLLYQVLHLCTIRGAGQSDAPLWPSR